MSETWKPSEGGQGGHVHSSPRIDAAVKHERTDAAHPEIPYAVAVDIAERDEIVPIEEAVATVVFGGERVEIVVHDEGAQRAGVDAARARQLRGHEYQGAARARRVAHEQSELDDAVAPDVRHEGALRELVEA